MSGGNFIPGTPRKTIDGWILGFHEDFAVHPSHIIVFLLFIQWKCSPEVTARREEGRKKDKEIAVWPYALPLPGVRIHVSFGTRPTRNTGNSS